jgi:RNA polymerase sigma factor (sigma-70 family)
LVKGLEPDWSAFCQEYDSILRRGLVHLDFIRNNGILDDCLQETWKRIMGKKEDKFSALKKFRGKNKNSFKKYLLILARNASYNYFKSKGQSKEQTLPFSDDQELSEDEVLSKIRDLVQGKEESVLDKIELEELQKHLDKVISGLRAEWQRVIQGKGSGLKDKEIARLLGLPTNTVSTWYRRAILEIRKEIEKFFNER